MAEILSNDQELDVSELSPEEKRKSADCCESSRFNGLWGDSSEPRAARDNRRLWAPRGSNHAVLRRADVGGQDSPHFGAP